MFYSNCKWIITFKNCDSLYRLFETNNIEQQLQFNLKKKRILKGINPQGYRELEWNDEPKF